MTEERKGIDLGLPSDRRTYQRWSTHLIVRYGLGEDLVAGDGYNISEGGLALTGAKTFPAGTLLDVKFRFEAPAAQFFSAKAVVRHSQEGQMGVEFVDLGPSEKARILEMIYRDIALRRR